MIKRQFDNELQDLKNKLFKMALLTENAIKKSIDSLLQRDKTLAESVIANDKEIDNTELLIDELCIDLLVRRQPLAFEFRLITMGMKFNTELERIADLAVNISERVLDIVDQPQIEHYTEIKEFSILAVKMLKNAIDSFVDGNENLAKEVILSDTQANSFRDSIQKKLVDNYLYKDTTKAPVALSLFLLAQHLERICDHITYIAEDVIYLTTAKVIKHNRSLISKD